MFRMLQHFTKEDREQYIECIQRMNVNLDKLLNGTQETAAVEDRKSTRLNSSHVD